MSGIAKARRSVVSQRVDALLDVKRPLAAGASRFGIAFLLLLAMPSIFLVTTAAADAGNQRGAAGDKEENKRSKGADGTGKAVQKDHPPRRFEDWLIDDGDEVKLLSLIHI